MRSDFETNSYSEPELVAEFEQLFPHGFAGADVVRELAGAGWEHSPLLAVFHPSLTQIYEETLHLHRNRIQLGKAKDSSPPPTEPTLDEVAREYREHPIDTEGEIRELVGKCLWDVFSDNHDVVAADGRTLDLGSFRSSGGFLADLLNGQLGTEQYDYLDFYLGTIWIAQRADLTPVYQMIFRRLHGRGLDWVYHTPRLQVVDLRPLKQELDRQKEPEWLHYSPSEGLAQEEEQKEHDQNLAELRESLEEGNRAAIEEALRRPPPPTVRAYEAVYGCFPKGWPPVP